MISGSEALMRALEHQGVKTIFGYPGGSIMPVYDALYDYKDKRAYVKSITLYSKSIQDIGQTDDCVGLETFINNYMHMDYTDNLGYCSDSTHHYYSSAKDAFNLLNDHQRKLFTTNSFTFKQL